MIYRLFVIAQLTVYGILAVQADIIRPRQINERDTNGVSTHTDYDAFEAFREENAIFRKLGSISLPTKPVQPPLKPAVKPSAPVYVAPPVNVVPPVKPPAVQPVVPPVKPPAVQPVVPPVTKPAPVLAPAPFKSVKKPKKGR
jgi:hypothetical protein